MLKNQEFEICCDLETVMKKNDPEKQYHDITALYDSAEELAATVEDKSLKNPDDQLDLVEPLIEAIVDSADLLCEEYIAILEKPSRKRTAKVRIENALRKIFAALEEYRAALSEAGSSTLAVLSNIADPVVAKIRIQVEKITIIFMQLLQISLDRVMQKRELDEFKAANKKMYDSLQQIGY